MPAPFLSPLTGALCLCTSHGGAHMHLTCSTHTSQCTLSMCRFSVGARGAGRAQSIRVPLDGLRTAAELISSAVDHGAEEVDPEMSVENVQVVYVDRSGRTKPVGSKTGLSLLKKARKVRISPIGVPLRTASVEKVRPSAMPAWLCSALPCARSCCGRLHYLAARRARRLRRRQQQHDAVTSS